MRGQNLSNWAVIQFLASVGLLALSGASTAQTLYRTEAPVSQGRPVPQSQPIEPIDVPPSIEQGVDLIYIDPEIEPEVKRRTELLSSLNLREWSGAPIDLFTSVNPTYTELRRGLMKYRQRWGDLPQVQIPAGSRVIKAGVSDDRIPLLRHRLGLPDGVAFDAELTRAVSEYQTAHGLKPDSIVGNGTVRSLNLGHDHYQRVVILNMERALRLPAPDEMRPYILIDAGAARLWMYENGRAVDSMRVIVGEAKTQTPMMAALIKYVSLNPYWNVPPELVQSLVARNVLEQGMTYFTDRNYEVLSDWTDDAILVDPTKVDWQAVAAGKKQIRVRRGPGPWNSMGEMKFMLPNDFGIYLHDVPEPTKGAFAKDDRAISNGCVRLEDAKRLQKWIFGGAAPVATGEADQRVDLPKPIPVYMTYFTAIPTAEGIAFRTDHYNRDDPLLARVKLER